MENPVEIFFQHPDKSLNKDALIRFAEQILRSEKLPVVSLSIIFVDDEYLKNLHEKYLNDETYTDVMTFDLGKPGKIEGEIYISLERAREQAQEFGVYYTLEIARLIIHGILHLSGLNDATPAEQRVMKEKEEFYLNKYANEIKDFVLNRFAKN